MIRRESESGFSLVELTLAAMMTVGLIGGIFALVNQNQQVFVAGQGVTDMNENVRTAIDLITRDIQVAGAGLPRGTGNFAAIYYINGSVSDSIMMVNADPYAPTGDVQAATIGGSTGSITLNLPTGVTNAPSFSYTDQNGTSQRIYQSATNNPSRQYIVYDDTKAMVFPLTADASWNSGAQTLGLSFNTTTWTNPAGQFSSPIDTGQPNYASIPVAKVAALSNTVAYQVDSSNQLLRTEDLVNWYPVARGIVSLKITYRIETVNSSGTVTQTLSSAPATRQGIRSVIVTLSAQTPDFKPTDAGYRRTVELFEVAPRNLNLVNNSNLASS